MAARFVNLDGWAHPAFRDLLRWKLGLGPPVERRRPAPGSSMPRVANDGASLREAQHPALTWIGHATYLVQGGGRSVLTDPVLSDRIWTIARTVPPGLSWDALPKIDAVTLSHNHYDHMDAPTLRRLGPDVLYLVPRGLGDWFRKAGLPRVVEMDWWQRHEADGLAVTFVPAQHWSRRGLTDMNRTLWGGFVIEAGPARVYHSGDTAYFEGFADIGARLGPLDAALLPIGAYEPRWFMKWQHMDPADAVQAFVDLGARRFLAMHWGTFGLTDEPLDEPPQRLRALWAERGLDPARLFVPAVGETVWL